jgi:iron-sulfur cluster assembly protein
MLVQQGRPEEAGLRLRVRGGGCSGLMYEMDLEDRPGDGDLVAEQHGVRVFVDPKSAEFVQSSHIDWESEIMGSRFRISNPQARASCSCGESFHA